MVNDVSKNVSLDFKMLLYDSDKGMTQSLGGVHVQAVV